MKSTCPHCGTTFRIDPAKVPSGGVRARCSRCGGVFPVSAAGSAPAPAAPPTPPPAAPASPPAAAAMPPLPAAEAAPSHAAPPAPPAFGRPDPQAKARRLARALISDIAVYHPERRDRGLAEGTLRQEFRDEIRRSWEEYVAQVGDSVARGTPFFREALNDILAGGRSVF